MNFRAVPTPKGPEEKGDLGFGAVVSTNARRLLNPDGTFNVRRTGLPWSEAVSFYHAALVMPWPAFVGLYWLELAAYQLGIWRGCWRWRTLRPLLPRLCWRR